MSMNFSTPNVWLEPIGLKQFLHKEKNFDSNGDTRAHFPGASVRGRFWTNLWVGF
jgi:hypothetical protein